MIVNPVVVDMDVGIPQPVTIDMDFSDAINVIVRPVDLQDKTVTPSEETQYVTYDSPRYAGLGTVTVNPIPSNYGKITWNGVTLTIT